MLQVAVVLGFYVQQTAKVIGRWDLSFKSHPKDCRSLGIDLMTPGLQDK